MRTRILSVLPILAAASFVVRIAYFETDKLSEIDDKTAEEIRDKHCGFCVIASEHSLPSSAKGFAAGPVQKLMDGSPFRCFEADGCFHPAYGKTINPLSTATSEIALERNEVITVCQPGKYWPKVPALELDTHHLYAFYHCNKSFSVRLEECLIRNVAGKSLRVHMKRESIDGLYYFLLLLTVILLSCAFGKAYQTIWTCVKYTASTNPINGIVQIAHSLGYKYPGLD